MAFSNGEGEKVDDVSSALDELSKKWTIDPIVRDVHLGKRTDIEDYTIRINKVTFHIPFLSDSSLFLLWDCLWPDCHNCCEKQGRLPLTSKDVANISKHLGYVSQPSFLRNETYVATWDNRSASDSNSQVITTLTMLNLKRKKSENETDNGHPITCRFLNECGECQLHPNKPGVCWLYPFFSWSQNDKNLVSVHSSFQLTGDCPGFYLSTNLDDIMPILIKYSEIIYNYTMNVNTTIREGFGKIDVVN
jgi:Fe-S-cluster containining protein